MDPVSDIEACFINQGILKDHAVSHFKSSMKPFLCSYCNLYFRTQKNRRDHIQGVHSTLSNSLDDSLSNPLSIIFCDIGISKLAYDRLLVAVSFENYSLPESLSNLYKRLETYGGRVHQGILFDAGLVSFQLKHVECVEKNSAANAQTRRYIKSTLINNCLSCFSNLVKIIPNIGSIPLKSSFHYRKLTIAVLKGFHTYVEAFNNSGITCLVESRQYNLEVGCRIGMKLCYSEHMHVDAIKWSLSFIKKSVPILDEVCRETSVDDFVEFRKVDVDRGLIIWGSIGPRDYLKRIPSPRDDEVYDLMGFSF